MYSAPDFELQHTCAAEVREQERSQCCCSRAIIFTDCIPTCHPTDNTLPTLTITLSGALGATALKEASSATVKFPAISAEDSAVGPVNITCSWEGNADVPYAGGFKADFPVGKTKVTCQAIDGSGNPSDPASFSVTVCAPGVSFANGTCTGAWGCREQRGECAEGTECVGAVVGVSAADNMRRNLCAALDLGQGPLCSLLLLSVLLQLRVLLHPDPTCAGRSSSTCPSCRHHCADPEH
jgi:hypothetical protein